MMYYPFGWLAHTKVLCVCFRAVNNAVLDTYQLKSLDAVLEAPIEEIQVIKRNGKLYLVTTDDEESAIDNFAMREPYDRIIRCLGFNFDSSIFKK